MKQPFKPTATMVVEKAPAKYKCTITLPNGKQYTQWCNSWMAITQFREAHGVPISDMSEGDLS